MAEWEPTLVHRCDPTRQHCKKNLERRAHLVWARAAAVAQRGKGSHSWPWQPRKAAARRNGECCPSQRRREPPRARCQTEIPELAGGLLLAYCSVTQGTASHAAAPLSCPPPPPLLLASAALPACTWGQGSTACMSMASQARVCNHTRSSSRWVQCCVVHHHPGCPPNPLHPMPSCGPPPPAREAEAGATMRSDSAAAHLTLPTSMRRSGLVLSSNSWKTLGLQAAQDPVCPQSIQGAVPEYHSAADQSHRAAWRTFLDAAHHPAPPQITATGK